MGNRSTISNASSINATRSWKLPASSMLPLRTAPRTRCSKVAGSQ